MSPKTQQVDVVFLVKNFRISEPQIHRNSSEAQTMSQENLNKNVKTYCRPVGMAPETTGQNDLITTTRNEKTHRNGNTKTLRAFTSSVPRNLESQTLPRMISTRVSPLMLLVPKWPCARLFEVGRNAASRRGRSGHDDMQSSVHEHNVDGRPIDREIRTSCEAPRPLYAHRNVPRNRTSARSRYLAQCTPRWICLFGWVEIHMNLGRATCPPPQGLVILLYQQFIVQV